MNLHTLTGFESGVVLYTPDNAMLEGFVCNWSAIDGLPRLFATALIGWGDGDDLQVGSLSEDERALALALATEEEAQPTIDRVWRNEQAVVVTFKDWN